MDSCQQIPLAVSDGKTKPKSSERQPLGYIAEDGPSLSNQRARLWAPPGHRLRVLRDRFVHVVDPLGKRSGFLGRIIGGPYFSFRAASNEESAGEEQPCIFAEIEIEAELVQGRPIETKSRPAPGAVVHDLTDDEVATLLGFAGEMLLGSVSGRESVLFRLQSRNKAVLPRNVGIFGTVGSGKSNTAQVLVEEASANGWAVIVVDVESEYTEMDQPSAETALHGELARVERAPEGLSDFSVQHPAGCGSERAESRAFTLRLADFETSVIAEIVHASLPERNALLECVEHFEQKGRNKLATTEMEGLQGLLDPAAQPTLAYTLRNLRDRAAERAARSTDFMDYAGLSTKLMWLLHSGAFDQPNLPALDAAQMLQPGRVTVVDVSTANEIVKNLVTADLLRKTFAFKMVNADAPPTLLVIEEAHSFVSRERVQTMQATLHMLRSVTRRGRKRWLSMAFVSQQPGHLPPEIFELCNTRIVHTLRSMHNLEALMATAGDVGREVWDRCPLLGAGEAIVTSPQLKRPVMVSVRPARSRRKFVN